MKAKTRLLFTSPISQGNTRLNFQITSELVNLPDVVRNKRLRFNMLCAQTLSHVGIENLQEQGSGPQDGANHRVSTWVITFTQNS